MKAVTFQALHQPLKAETLPDPTPGEGEVVVHVGRCGICGSDLHMTEDAAYGCKHGDVIGHEFAGEIVGLGGVITKGSEELLPAKMLCAVMVIAVLGTIIVTALDALEKRFQSWRGEAT